MKNDIVFISCGEPQADQNFAHLTKISNSVGCKLHRVRDVDGVFAAHKAASQMSTSDFFYVVDGDNWVWNFKFDITPDRIDRVHVMRSYNPAVNITYGYGGIKLYHKSVFDNIPGLDIASSVVKSYKAVEIVASETRFNTDAFHSWMGAFRENIKLLKENSDISLERYRCWRNVDNSTAFGSWILQGVIDAEYFLKRSRDLTIINNKSYLKDYFERNYK